MAGEFWFAAVDFPIGGGEPKMITLSKGISHSGPGRHT